MPTGLANKPAASSEGKELSLRALAYQHEDHWVAACIDLDIFVQGDSYSDARAKLLDQVRLYLHTVLAEGKPEKGLIPRRAPARYFILWWIVHFSRWVAHHQKAFSLKGTPGRLVIA